MWDLQTLEDLNAQAEERELAKKRRGYHPEEVNAFRQNNGTKEPVAKKEEEAA